MKIVAVAFKIDREGNIGYTKTDKIEELNKFIKRVSKLSPDTINIRFIRA